MLAVPVPGGPLLAQCVSTHTKEHASLEPWLVLCCVFRLSFPAFSLSLWNSECMMRWLLYECLWVRMTVDFWFGILHSTSDQIRGEVVFEYKFLNPSIYLIFIWVISWAWSSTFPVACQKSWHSIAYFGQETLWYRYDKDCSFLALLLVIIFEIPS